MKILNYLKALSLFVLIIIIILILIIIYAYNSGSCQINKKYICDKKFCLLQEFAIELNENIKNDIDKMVENKSIQKRVSITSYVENIFNCALPNRKGITIPTQNIIDVSPDLISFYKNYLCKKVSQITGLKLYPTALEFPTSCAIIIYEKEGDWINWHYDYNYYDGRFFTVLVPITHVLTCAKFQFKDKNNNVVDKDLTNNAICFEGNYVYHRASKLCENQKRIILSCQYVTDNSMSFINQARIKLKDYAFIGKLF
jgi:hypothetical protein